MGAVSGIKYEWIIDEINFLKRNFYAMTNRQLADSLGLTLTLVRTKCYELGLKRIELQRWTKEQENFLKDHYRSIGDTEMAEIFTERWKKPKGWSKKHIEKKRRYMNLKRTKAERKAINKRNVETGRFKVCPVNAWLTRGQAEEGTIKVWNIQGNDRSFIKTESGFVCYPRWLWENHYGPITDNRVVYTEKIVPDSVNDLQLITRAKLARINKQGFDELPDELKTAIKLTNKLKKNL